MRVAFPMASLLGGGAMEQTKQLSVALPNEPGQMAGLCCCLAECKINVVAISVVDSSDQGIVRLVVNKPKEAAEALKDCGLTVTQTDVLLMELPNRVGVLADVAERLQARKVNINFLYGSTGKGRGKALIVLGTSNLKSAQRALAAL
jgi:hypothetical protein